MPDSSFKNFYDVLGIEREASADEVRRAYRKKALETHPDKLDPGAGEGEKQKAEREFHKVHEAFEVLSDAVKRKAYDFRINARKDPSLISEEAKRRIQERKEWAQRHREESLKRTAELNKQLEREKRAKKDALAKVEREAEMLAQMVKEMHQSNPEFAARRQAALQVCSSTPFIGGYTKRDTFTPAPPIHIHTRTFTSPKIHTPALIFILPPIHSHSPDPLDSHSAHVFN